LRLFISPEDYLVDYLPFLRLRLIS
jgi:hypothetical protein